MTDRPTTVLVVDDDEVFGEVLSRQLDARGFDCTHSVDTHRARSLAAQQRFDCALLDLRLEEASGLSLIEPLLEASPEIRIIVLTGYASIATAVQAVKLGAADYLTKPVAVDQVAAALRGGPHETPPAREVPADPMSVRRLEWEHIHRVLAECDGNVSAAARRLNMHRRTLQRKLARRPVGR